MWIETVKGKPRSLVAARGLAIIGFLALTVMAYAQDNYLVSALFTLPAAYYCRKLMKKSPPVERQTARHPVAPADVDAVKSELREMLVYYQRLRKGWLWIGALGWGCTALTVYFAPSIFLVIVLGLAGYASYAYMRCQNAIRLIEAGNGNGG
jgi:hypothetical protein